MEQITIIRAEPRPQHPGMPDGWGDAGRIEDPTDEINGMLASGWTLDATVPVNGGAWFVMRASVRSGVVQH